jgi:hypothetical protein
MRKTILYTGLLFVAWNLLPAQDTLKIKALGIGLHSAVYTRAWPEIATSGFTVNYKVNKQLVWVGADGYELLDRKMHRFYGINAGYSFLFSRYFFASVELRSARCATGFTRPGNIRKYDTSIYSAFAQKIQFLNVVAGAGLRFPLFRFSEFSLTASTGLNYFHVASSDNYRTYWKTSDVYEGPNYKAIACLKAAWVFYLWDSTRPKKSRKPKPEEIP